MFTRNEHIIFNLGISFQERDQSYPGKQERGPGITSIRLPGSDFYVCSIIRMSFSPH